MLNWCPRKTVNMITLIWVFALGMPNGCPKKVDNKDPGWLADAQQGMRNGMTPIHHTLWFLFFEQRSFPRPGHAKSFPIARSQVTSISLSPQGKDKNNTNIDSLQNQQAKYPKNRKFDNMSNSDIFPLEATAENNTYPFQQMEGLIRFKKT